MKLEKQVCSLQQAKRLKELGIQQDSLFSWIHEGHHHCGQDEIPAKPSQIVDGCSSNLDFPYQFDGCAFTVAELGVMFGIFMDKEKNDVPDEWFDTMVAKYGENLSTCYNPLFLADYLIYLLENSLITAADCNQRLVS